MRRITSGGCGSVRAVTEPGEEVVLPCDFGKYRLTRRIATGGMAEIFLAHRHDAPLEPVVIKRILPHLIDTEGFVSMFLDEARIAAGLDHPNIVRIDDIGQIDGAYFLAMEYVHGEDIRCIYNKAYKLQRSLPLSHSIQVVADAARGLAHAHRATDFTGKPMGLVHRDVSPQNILVTYDGEAKVVDFGIAKAVNKVAQTRAGVLKGKYSYMSPEQALGEEIDHRTDLFALGIILYETTTGTRLFKRSNELATLQAIIKGQITPPSKALPGYPEELETIVLGALTKEPAERYQDGEVLADDLERFLDTSGLRAPRAKIAAFMAELFADKLAEEEAMGEPAGPDPQAAREELAEPAPEPERQPQARLSTEVGTRKRAALAAEAPAPGFSAGGEDIDATRAERSGEIPQVAVRAMPSEERTALAGENVPSAPDEAATLAVTSAYRPPEPEPAVTSAPRGFVEPTERIRMKASAPSREPQSELGRVEPDETIAPRVVPSVRSSGAGPSKILVGAVIILGVTLGVGVVALKRARTRSSDAVATYTPEETTPEPERLGAPAGMSEVTIVTEPSAEVFVDGEAVGFADAQGRAGPFPLEAGERLVRVASDQLPFERQRVVQVKAGQAMETEIRARRGYLRVRVGPWARVTVDGKAYGLTPLPPLSLYEGLHEVVLENPDLDARKVTSARVLAGEEALVQVSFAAE